MVSFRHNEQVSSRGRLATPVLYLLIVAVLVGNAFARARTAGKTAIDSDYVAALSLANRFLSAWQNRDHEAALLMLTNSAKQHTTEERFGAFISGNGGQQAFLITTGKKISSGRFDFPVALFDSSGTSVHRRFSHIIVIRAGKDEWAVDTLP
jgi:hypothetical protein